MKKWIIGYGAIALALAAAIAAYTYRSGAPEQESPLDSSGARAGNIVRAELSNSAGGAMANSATPSQDGEKQGQVKAAGAVVTAADSSACEADDQGAAYGATSEGTSSAVINQSAKGNWPSPSKSRVVGKTIAYRSVELPPNSKGGGPGELREWLIEPEEGYIAHVEEEYRPDGNGEMQLVAVNQYAANQVLLTLDGEVAFEAFKAQMEQRGAIVKAPLMELEKGARIVAVMVPEVSFESVANLREAVASYDSSLSVGNDAIRSVERIPNDARYSSQWGLPKIQATGAWDIRTDASSVVVGVLDSGVRYDHQDLADNMWVRSSSASAGNYRHGIKSIGGSISGNPMDDNGHGTHCAGIIGAVGNNSTGVSGVAWRAKIMALKFMDSSGNGAVSDEIAAINWAMTNGVDIISMSFGGYGYSAAEDAAIGKLRNSGIIAVCASGNDAVDTDVRVHTPAALTLDNIVSVASTTSSDALSSFSNYGATSVDIAAPGSDILSTYCSSVNSYTTLNGTSMAAPFVSGALALLKAQYPSYTYLQLIQKLYAGGDSLSVLSGKCATGKRLNVYKALSTAQLVSPVPSATKGTYADHVNVSWPAVSGAAYYRVYRASSSSGAKAALGSWQTATSYSDSSVVAGTTYYYWVCAATSSSGANQSEYGSYSTGYAQASSGDAWDPGDDTPSGGTSITPTASRSTHGTHTLSGTDAYDFFKISMTAGTRYTFETTGSMDTYGELFNSAATDSSSRVAYNDDGDGANDRNFRIEYTPTSSGTYYLRVRAYSVGSSGSYTLAYRRSAAGDSWDPGDDAPASGTALSPTASVQTHGPHTLSADDRYDFFRISMTAGQKYVFESTGSSDVYGELFNSTSTNAAHLVAYNDDIDGSNNRNFRIEYTPTTAGTYYLRVRSWSAEYPDRTYSLRYSQVQSVASIDAVFCSFENGWPDSVFLGKNGGTAAQTSFTQGDTVTIFYQWTESDDRAVPGPLTNCAKIVNQATGATRYTWQNYWVDGLSAGYFGSSHLDVSGLEAGAYTLRMALNEDKNGNHSVAESSYANNVRTIAFTIVDSQKTLASIAISGNASIASKSYANYRCTATYSDGSSADVSPTWSISSGSSYAAVDDSGRVTAGDVTVDREIVLRAEFGGKSATKAISIRGYAGTPDPEDDYDPFGPIVPYPRAPMIVEGVLYINNVPATADDMIAAYSGNEVRGIASTDSSGRFTVGVNIAEANERISFKAYDASEGDNGTVFNCLQSLLGSSDPQGTASSPVRFDALPSDPFGQVARDPLVPPTIIEASVTIDGEAASSGDILAVFSGNTIIGKASVVYDNQNGHATAACSVVMFFSGRKTLSFKLWDADEEEILESSTTIALSSGDVEGTAASPREIAFSLDVPVPCPVSLRTGWNLVSFSALPDPATPASVFSEASSSVQYVCDVQGNLWSPSSSSPGLSVIRLGEGYWVRSSSGDVSWNVEGRGNPDMEISLSPGWNLIGYTLPRAGQVANVLHTALASGRVQYITDQNGNVYPGGSLTSMQPGVGYWVRATGAYAMKFESAGMETTSASLAIMSGASVGGHPFGTPLTRVGMPTIFDGVSVSLFGKPAAFGDYLAVFDRNTDELLAVQQVNTEDGTLMFTIMGLGRNDKLCFKVWNSASGLDSPEIFAVPQSNDLTISSPDDPVVGLRVDITGTKPTYTVRYELNGKATRTGGGALSQNVAFGGDAVDPVISANSGWRFVAWDYSRRTDIRSDMTISALYEADSRTPSPRIGGTSKFTLPGGLQATLVGMENVQWGDFSGSDQFGAKTLVHAGIHDAEKTAGANMKDDDTWCYPLSDMNALFWTGWAQARTSYANVDAMANYFRSRPTLLRTWRNGGPQEGQYGYDGLFDWFKDTTGQDLSGSMAKGRIDRTFGSAIRPLLDDGGHVIRLAVYFSETANPKWSWCNEYGGVSHGVLCVGYVADTTKGASDPAALKALFIVDPDNDQQTGSGGASAPNSVAYCPVSWNSASGTWSVEGIWGETSVLCNVGDFDSDGYRALANYSGGGGDWDPAAIRVDVDDQYETDADGSFYLDLLASIRSASAPKVVVKGLPAGLKYDARSGVISGRVTKPGEHEVVVNVTNATVKKPVTATFRIVVPNIACQALPNLQQDGDAYGVVMCGVEFDPELVDCTAEEGWTVKVSGLPTGLKYDARTGAITGVPTKAGTFTVTFKATKKGEPDQVATITLKTEPLPVWATGTFYGYADVFTGSELDWQQAGSATFTVSANGKATGKVLLGGTNWTFTASYAHHFLDDSSEFLELDGQLKSGKTTLPVTVFVESAESPYVDGGTLVNSVAYSYNEYSDRDISMMLWRNIWKDKANAAAAKRAAADLAGVYTLSFYDGGYLSLAVAKDGNVKASGKLSDGTGVSMASPMLFDNEEEGFFAVFYVAPSSYKGGALSMTAGFGNGEIVDLGGSWWVNRDPQASATYGAAVEHDCGFFGAYYDKLAKLSAYYDSLRFEVADLPLLGYLFKYTYIDGDTGRKVTESWTDVTDAVDTLEQDGLTVAVNANGAPAVEKATKPVLDRNTQEWLYEGRNDGALTLSFAQATGIFKGSYTFWYDYESAYDETTDKTTWAHTSKKANFEGIFVQGAEPTMNGFLLWDATGEYEDPKTGKAKTYKYRQSFPVSL